MEIFQLECFLNVHKYQSFSNAAEEMFLSQSSVSKQIAKLEKELSVKLFHRSTKGIFLTNAGKEFYFHALPIVQEYHAMKKDLRKYQQEEFESTLHISSIGHIGKMKLMKPLALFLNEHKNLRFQISEGDTRKVIYDLMHSKADIGVIAYCRSPLDGSTNLPDFPVEAFTFHTLIQDEYYLAVNLSHPFAERRFVTWEDISKEKLILLDDSYSINGLVKNCFRALHLVPNITFEIAQSDVIMGLIKEDCGVSLFSSQVIEENSQIRKVQIHQPISRDTVLVVPKTVSVPSIRAFVTFLVEFYSNQM